MNLSEIEKLLGDQAKDLLNYQCKGLSKDLLHIPGRQLGGPDLFPKRTETKGS